MDTRDYCDPCFAISLDQQSNPIERSQAARRFVDSDEAFQPVLVDWGNYIVD
jgi:hypothetical protein